MFTITDQTTGQSVTVEAAQIAEAIAPWFPEAPAEVAAAIEDLEARARRSQYTGDVAAYLGVTILRA